MMQIIQSLSTGDTQLIDVPTPNVNRGEVLIRTHRSLVSIGTEKMLVSFGKASLLEKARQQPDRVKDVLTKVKTDGLIPTFEAVSRKLGQPLPLGYSNAGEVIGMGAGVTDFKIGDRVVSNGPHAEIVSVSQNLVARIPDEVSYDDAAFTVVGAIGLQGIRLVAPTFGECVVVYGLGLIGLLTVQLLQANGCKVIGIDVDTSKMVLAKSWGATVINGSQATLVNDVLNLTGGVGVDAVIITASSSSDAIISNAAEMSRKRGRIVLVGVVGLDIMRSNFYEKELTFQVSCSYGPGRYDPSYEEKGNDYPIGFVRWTEKRNFEAVLEAIRARSLILDKLVSERVPLQEFDRIYGNMDRKDVIASIIEYAVSDRPLETNVSTGAFYDGGKGQIGIVGAGNFTNAVILPTLKSLGANIKTVASARGLSGTLLAKKYKIPYSTTNVDEVLSDDSLDAVIITTRHDLHARQVIKGLQAGKHVFVEKPLALTLEELEEISRNVHEHEKSVMVGFNRRFSPFILKAKSLLGSEDKAINVIATMNAGHIDPSHWVHDMEIGGGRIVGEACHYVDLISFLTGAHVEEVLLSGAGISTDLNTDNATMILKYENGSLGVINYFSTGNKSYPKERIEIFDSGKNIVIDNFKRMKCFGYGYRGMRKSQDKGHKEQFRRWYDHIKEGGAPLIDFSSIYNTTKSTLLALESLKTNKWIKLSEY